MPVEILKAGWLLRRTYCLKRWRAVWFVLYEDGVLEYYKHPDNEHAEETAWLKTQCIGIRTHDKMPDMKLPAFLGRECLLMIVLYKRNWILCAESVEECRDWKDNLDKARLVQTAVVRTPQTAAGTTTSSNTDGTVEPYPKTNQISTTPTPTYVAVRPATTRVVYDPYYAGYPYYYRRRYYYNNDLAVGMMAGAMMSPFFWGYYYY